MNLQTFYPQNSILKKHIEYYYFLKTNSDNFTSTYYAFPNLLQSFNIHRYASCDVTSHSTIVYGDKRNKHLMIVQGQHELPLFVHLKGTLDKITILFKPLGLNHFIQNSIIKIAGEPSQVFTDWDEDKKCKKFLFSFYSTDNFIERIAVLENYLLSRYQLLSEEAILQKAINLLSDFDIEYSIEEIAKRLCMNNRSFNRMFNKHLGISPVGFRKIARFRHSLKNKLFKDQFKTLTEVGYESNYYDQSYFHKVYKKITGQNPFKFFSSIEKLADDQLIFHFVNK